MNNKNNLIEINKKEKLIKICTSNKKLLKKLLTYENHSEFLKLHENNYCALKQYNQTQFFIIKELSESHN